MVKVKTRALKTDLAHETPRWELGYLEAAEKEARSFLTEEQYAHAIQLFDDLAYESNPTKSETQDVSKIYEFYELRDKGGILGKINLRVYFTIFKERKLILVLATYKKEDDGKVPQHIVIRVRNRLRVAKELMAKNIQKG
jgi:hypothetical protein